MNMEDATRSDGIEAFLQALNPTGAWLLGHEPRSTIESAYEAVLRRLNQGAAEAELATMRTLGLDLEDAERMLREEAHLMEDPDMCDVPWPEKIVEVGLRMLMAGAQHERSRTS